MLLKLLTLSLVVLGGSAFAPPPPRHWAPTTAQRRGHVGATLRQASDGWGDDDDWGAETGPAPTGGGEEDKPTSVQPSGVDASYQRETPPSWQTPAQQDDKFM